MSGPSSIPGESDGKAFEQARTGDSAALAELVERYIPRLRAFVRLHVRADLRRRESSEDVVQSVCRELIEREACLRFPDEAGFRGWLFTVALSKIREKARFHGRARRDLGRERDLVDSSGRELALSQVYASACTPSRLAMAHEQIERFESAFDSLSDDHRQVIALARIASLPHAVVAERMGRSVGAVRQLLGRALLNLADELEREAG